MKLMVQHHEGAIVTVHLIHLVHRRQRQVAFESTHRPSQPIGCQFTYMMLSSISTITIFTRNTQLMTLAFDLTTSNLNTLQSGTLPLQHCDLLVSYKNHCIVTMWGSAQNAIFNQVTGSIINITVI